MAKKLRTFLKKVIQQSTHHVLKRCTGIYKVSFNFELSIKIQQLVEIDAVISQLKETGATSGSAHPQQWRLPQIGAAGEFL